MNIGNPPVAFAAHFRGGQCPALPLKPPHTAATGFPGSKRRNKPSSFGLPAIAPVTTH